jgi:hypothetical protein
MIPLATYVVNLIQYSVFFPFSSLLLCGGHNCCYCFKDGMHEEIARVDTSLIYMLLCNMFEAGKNVVPEPELCNLLHR